MSEIKVALLGSSTAPYDTWETAFSDIQDAIDYSSTGDIVNIDSGTYYLTSSITVNKAITITSRYEDSSTCVIDGDEEPRQVTIDHADAVLSNVTIQNLKGNTWGSVVVVRGTIYKCEIRFCEAFEGGGVYAIGNYTNYIRVLSCKIYENIAERYGGGVFAYGVNTQIINCLIYSNTSTGGSGGGVYIELRALVLNCTICDNNQSTNGVGGVECSNGYLENCIVYYNTSIINPANIHFTTGYVKYCCSLEGTGTNPIIEAPDFENRSLNNYKLTDSSPCINAGNMTNVSLVGDYDLDGNLRVVEGIIDIGAYEYQTGIWSSSSSSSSTVQLTSSSSSTVGLTSSSSLSSTSSTSISSPSSTSISSTSISSPSSTSISSLSSLSTLSSASSLSSSSNSSSIYDAVVFQNAGETYASPSLVIDVMNSVELVAETKNTFGSLFSQKFGWATEERLRGDFSRGMVQWGFKQTNGKISNAVVFTGENVVIHIASKGHGIGYIGETDLTPVFSKTQIRITLHDVYRNVEKSVVFNSFSKPISHPDRYILWQVCESDSWSTHSRSNNGVCGLYILKITDESMFYSRADWTNQIVANEKMKFPNEETYLQITSYEWRDALGKIQILPSKNINVLSKSEFRTASINPYTTDNEINIFDNNTIFPVYEQASGLSDEQKTTVIRDNAMVLLSTQGPLLPADSPKSKIIGIGMEVIPTSEKIERDVSIRPAAIINQSQDAKRTFSLSGKTVTTNVLDELSGIVSDHEQGDFVFADPILALAFSNNGVGASNLDNGLAFATAGLRIDNFSISNGGESAEFDMMIGDNNYEIDADDNVSSESSESSFSSSESSLSSESSYEAGIGFMSIGGGFTIR